MILLHLICSRLLDQFITVVDFETTFNFLNLSKSFKIKQHFLKKMLRFYKFDITIHFNSFQFKKNLFKINIFYSAIFFCVSGFMLAETVSLAAFIKTREFINIAYY